MVSLWLEEWKEISGYDQYEVSSMGRVRRNNKILKFQIVNEYYQLSLYKNGIRVNKYVHRLVLKTFKVNPNPQTLNMCDHINRNTFDNRISNLRWSNARLNSYNRNAKGYSYYKDRNKFVAEIVVDGQKIHLGQFKYSLDARRAYLNAKSKYHSYLIR